MGLGIDNPDPPIGNPSVAGAALGISIGTITPDDTLAIYVNQGDDTIEAAFPDYLIRGRYESDLHRYMIPVTDPRGYNGSPVVIVSLAPKTLYWIVEWTAARYKQIPIYPNYKTPPSPKWVLLDDHWEVAAPVPGPDGVTILYRLSGTIVYACTSPNDLTTEDIRFPVVPWIDPTQVIRTVVRTQASSNIL